MRRPAADPQRRVLRAGLAAWLALAPAAPVAAHALDPTQAAAEIAAGRVAAELGVVAARPLPGLPRLLHIEVDERWRAAAPERRLRAAETWRALWRESTPGGGIAVTDDGGASLVSFDADGHAALAAPPTGTLGAPSPDPGLSPH